MNPTVILTASNMVRHTALAVETVRRCLPNAPIIVVDHSSFDETRSYVNRLSKTDRNARLVKYEGELNLARCWNIGVEAAETDSVILANNDVLFAGSFWPHVEEMLSNQQTGAVLALDQGQAQIFGADEGPTSLAKQWVHAMRENHPNANRIAIDLINAVEVWNAGLRIASPPNQEDPFYRPGGFCFAFRKDVWKQIGPFNEKYDYYGEDWEWFSRLQKKLKLRISPNWTVWHFGKGTSAAAMETGERFDRLMKARFMLGEDCEGTNETVSVVMPAHGRVGALRDAVRSVIAQTYKHWRLYVVDDGTPDWDAVGKAVESFHDPRIGVWRLNVRQGPGAARNYALARTRGKYVAFLDSDDMWHPLHLETHVLAHERGGWSMTYSDPRFLWRWERNGRVLTKQDNIPTIKYWGEFDRERLERENYILTSSTVWWGDDARAMRFSDKEIEEDWDYFRQLRGTAKHIRAVTLTYTQQPEGDNQMAPYTRAAAPEGPPDGCAAQAAKRFRGAKFTAVIPTKNRIGLLERAIASLRGEVPVIVVDDGTEDFGELVRTVQRHPEASLYKNPGEGACDARNAGVSLASTEWVRFLDDDDIATPGSMVLFAAASEGADAVVCDCATAMPGGGFFIHGADRLYTSMLAVKRQSFIDAGGFYGEQTAEERSLVDRMVSSKMTVARAEGVGAVRTAGHGNKTGSRTHDIADVQERRRLARR